uniref:Uncharacterized protein n=1 Tax=Ascaris lumbricoides TaxID=6252 RepID=A0A0M3HRW6_ASCLU
MTPNCIFNFRTVFRCFQFPQLLQRVRPAEVYFTAQFSVLTLEKQSSFHLDKKLLRRNRVHVSTENIDSISMSQFRELHKRELESASFYVHYAQFSNYLYKTLLRTFYNGFFICRAFWMRATCVFLS